MLSIHSSACCCCYRFFLILFFLGSYCHAAVCNKVDQSSLLVFSQAISFFNWSTSSTQDCCVWEGITCDHNGRVTRLLLPSNHLRGIIHPSIANLTSLVHLNLSNNFLSGPLPPTFFTSLTQIQVIDLSSNRLFGQLPVPGGLPVTVKTLDLSNNHFNGTVPSSFLSQALQLETFNVSNNIFAGSIPSSICTYSPSLSRLDFSYNDFHGEIPMLGDCPKLEALRAGFNNLSGQLPRVIYSALTLREIFLAGNKLSGSIEEGITKLSNLRILSLYANQLTGIIPRNIGNLSSLEQLHLHINTLNGTLPSSLMNCTSLRMLTLRVNFLTGDLSSLDFSKLLQLSIIDLGNNNLSGNLPPSLYMCKSLIAIRLGVNRIQGQISPEIRTLPSLTFLSISNNSLTNITGAIKILMGCKNLRIIIFSMNFFKEAIPEAVETIDSDGFQNLQVLSMGGCNFTGSIPKWLGNLRKLQVLDLSYNRIKGSVPGWFANMSYLFYLDLSDNLLSGDFPKQLIQLPALTSREGADQLDGSNLELPIYVAADNQYNQLASLPPAIYLKNNSFSGNIPIEIGQLKYIQVLDLSCNKFSGTIPNQLSNLTKLEKLDLSGNNLTGEIPASLRQLNFLSSFSVANNSLHGPVPTGGQFDTFTNSSYEGNIGLCGPMTPRNCTSSSKPTHSSVHRRPNKKLIVGLILGICFGIGITLTVIALWILSKRKVLPRSEPDKIDMDTVSFNSHSVICTEFGKDTSLVILFPNITNEIKDLTISEILKATDNFSQANIVGCGGFGLVYKATLVNGTNLAVKKLSGDMGLMEREFKAEVEALSTAQHKNLVSLQGYCVHEGFRLLIYSYMKNGSLDYWLHEKTDGASQLDWPTRLQIARGASCGLAYMHLICEPHIVHRDIKSSNILLDDKFEAHVADFGLSRLILPYHTHVTTELVGTLGYIPPEYGQAWIATLRGDMYSFGVVMLELLTGKRPVEIFKPKMSRELVVWVQQLRSEDKQEEIFDPVLRDKGFEEEMLQVLDMACMCVNRNPFKRPTIREVVDCLKNVGSNSLTAQ
ncbi:tyrosine-sulfated glycopeptide receptor 1 [Apium graveolens]|uniref:tyrosine-sulfated glycopeptide receptor 1 n=1 Tax=Apium graveolens TaxID=4045 RepID=UPI003D7B4E4D